ncbi:transposase [Calidithermus chliarophilus]|uniref:transposase n=1 Tax=Calidithermus chliarophilus TaxID=52023 RepID=UPI003B836D8F
MMAPTEARGIPVSLAVYPASTHESQTALAVLQRVRIPRAKGKPRKRIRVLAMDKAFDSTPLRRRLRAKGIRASVPEHQFQNRRRRGPKPKPHPASHRHYQVERLHAWLDNYRALVVRYGWQSPHLASPWRGDGD